MNFDRAIVGVLQTHANIAWIVDLLVMQVAVDIGAIPTDGVRMNRDVTKDDLVAVLIFLDYVRPNIIEERKVLVQLKNVMITLD